MFAINRTHMAIWIVLILIVLVLLGAQTIHQECARIKDQLDQIEECVLDENYTEAQQLSKDLAWSVQHNLNLRLFIRRDLLAELCTALSGIPAYTQIEYYADLRSEIEKARNQVRALNESFFGFA